MESDIVDLTITQAFHETKWIGLGKLYPSGPPQFIDASWMLELDFSKSRTPCATVIGFQTKSAGKNVRHQSSKSADNISSVSYVSVQVFDHTFSGRFTALTSRTTWGGTNQFESLPPSQVLCILSSQPRAPSLREVQLGQTDLNVFTNLCGGLEALKLAMVKFRKKELR
ncbi:hypothetical protein BDN72DRAFT_935064 [Pluteus cervinus]|uniref:Uncharacterized protein n=1 Tax=Pluteus cervinus TaxID=181527 RepID=A0ACD3A731_9AGAR|nr:hypothetical protein BDN72DRAFT_935064 [Pluteus cervinus]